MARITLFMMIIIWTIFINTSKAATPKFPAIFVFGDSTVDTGNNDYITTCIRANYAPYGQDFPGKIPTGRFSNGKLIPDLVASALGIKKLVPPFLNPELPDDELITGINFASAGSGFDNLTAHITRAIPVFEQVNLFKDYAARLEGIAGEKKAKAIISGALVLISVGANDWIYNFYDIRERRLQYDAEGYRKFLLAALQTFVIELYSLGLRTMAIAGLPPIGCLPLQMLRIGNFGRKCLKNQNSDSQSYNKKLQILLPQIQAILPKSKLFYTDSYHPVMDMIKNPHKYGFVETRKGCCNHGPLKTTTFRCNALAATCKDASKYIFWDIIHPTQVVYQHISSTILKTIFQNYI